MKKLFGWFSLTIILIMSVYVCIKILALPVDYAETANSIMNDVIKGQSLLTFNYRVYDYFCEILICMAAAIGIKVILQKLK